MSLELARQVDRAEPHLLETNIGSTCHLYTLRLISLLRSQGYDAHLMAKTHGEGQYTPPGFTPRNVIGLDGQVYICTGVSHDAIWVDGAQVDTAARANDSDEPIYENDEKRARGERITAVPVWNLIPEHLWRARNPPLRDQSIVLPPVPPSPQSAPAPQHMHPGREEMMKAGEWLDAFYRSSDGLQRSLIKDGGPDWEGIGAWLFDVFFTARMNGKTVDEAKAAVVTAIQQTDEWKRKH